MHRYTEEEIGAEEERIGARLPGELRRRYSAGIAEVVALTDPEGHADEFDVIGPSTTDTDTRGRSYPTAGMARETQEARDTDDDFVPDDVLVAWARAANGDLAVVRRDGSLGWWRLGDDEVTPAEVDWDPQFEDE